jgi:poly(A) polymerase
MSQSESPPSVSPEDIAATIYGPDDHPIRKNQIDDDARKIVYRLQRAGYKAYIVGGGVRDLVLGKQPKDFDISTSATPREIKSLFRNCRIIGRRFKLAHLYFAHGKNIEVSTFRDTIEVPEQPEGETVGAPVLSDNIYGTEVTDAFRRDLTINGLFLDVSTMEILDYVGGMQDLRDGIVRVIGEPAVRFQEDPVRMLRVVRHSARNGFRINTACWDAILANAGLILQSSQVRVFDELKKDFTSGHFLTILHLLSETGLLEYILPELLENDGRLLSAESDFSQCLERIDDFVSEERAPSTTVILTIIAMFIAGDSVWLEDLAERLPEAPDLSERLASCFTRLVVPRKEREKIQLILNLWSKVRSIPPKAMKPNSFKRTSLLPDLISLLEVTCLSKEDAQRIHLLRPLLHEEDEDLDHESHHRGGRNRPHRHHR